MSSSSSKQFEVSEATSSDLGRLGQIYSASFINVGSRFFPSGMDDEYVSWRTTRLGKYLARMEYEKNTNTRGKYPWDESHLIKASIKGTGEIAGFLYFTVEPEIKEGLEGGIQRQRRDEREKSLPQVVPTIPKQTNERLWRRFIELMDLAKEEYMGKKPYVSIELLAVSSDHRGLGIGRQLVQHCFEIVSALQSSVSPSHGADSVPFFLCATPLAVPMYERLGFKVLRGLPDPFEEEKDLLQVMIRRP